jgi:acyl carrier protein
MTAPGRKAAAPPSDEDVLAYLKEICQEELELPPEQVAKIDLHASVVEGLQLDSLAQVILLGRIEEEYEIIFEPEHRERLQTVRTVQDLVAMIRGRIEEQRRAPEGAS